MYLRPTSTCSIEGLGVQKKSSTISSDVEAVRGPKTGPTTSKEGNQTMACHQWVLFLSKLILYRGLLVALCIPTVRYHPVVYQFSCVRSHWLASSMNKQHTIAEIYNKAALDLEVMSTDYLSKGID